MCTKKGSFISDVLILVGGTTFAQIVGILAYPMLTRLYGPEDFGTWAIFISITGIVSTIACMRYELAILLPESDDDAINILGLSLLIALFITILTVPLLFIFKETLILSLNSPQLENYLWLSPPFIFISTVFLALNYWNSRNKNFKRLSLAKVYNSLSTIGIQITSGIAGYFAGGGLLLGSITGQSVSTIVLSSQVWKSDKASIKTRISFKRMYAMAKRYRKFPLIESWAALMNVVSWQLPTFLLASFFSPAVAGFYALGFRLLQLPMNLIGSSISDVFFQRASIARYEGTLDSLVENVLRILIIVSLFPISILTIAGSDLFYVFFGQEWVEAGVYAQILGIWAFVWFISSPLSAIFSVMEIQQYELTFNFLNIITRLLSLVIGGFMGSARIALLLFSISGVLVYGYFLWRILIYSGIETFKLIKIISSNFILFIPAGIVLLIVKLLSADQLLVALLSIILICLYYFHLLKTDEFLNKIVNYPHVVKKMSDLIKK
ncbi:oligosaccharide flippase family protein [Methanomethylovorans sp.]|uniref:oligosaccharide flippase family protein n=1 Tax=Methanomethylovorans sp. TaxID=2758717 RepID=UPI003D0A4235